MNRELDLAEVHSVLGMGNYKLLSDILKDEVYKDFSRMSRDKKQSFFEKFDLDNLKVKKIYERLSKLNFLNIEECIEEFNIRITDSYCNDYPEKLRNIKKRPLLIYCRGNYPQENYKLAVVGSRNPSVYAKECVRKIVSKVSKAGVSIVSGMALGIDKVAHEAALLNETGTIGVLGSGIDIIAPKVNKKLYEAVNNHENSCLISEFPLGTEPCKFTFPVRNRVIAGLGEGILVGEAGEKSGSLISAKYAYEQGKNIYAIPGMVTNPLTKGVHRLIKDGAKLTESEEDILEDIFVMEEYRGRKEKSLNLSETELSIIRIIESNPSSIEEIADFIGINYADLIKSVSILEIKGYIMKEKNNKYIRIH